MEHIAKNILETIGNTPLVRINRMNTGAAEIAAKVESFNPGSSSKDRIGIAMILDAEQMDIELPDPKDRVFYEVVMEGRKREDAYLITGNLRHFPSEPFIVTPRQMLDIVVGDREKDIP